MAIGDYDFHALSVSRYYIFGWILYFAFTFIITIIMLNLLIAGECARDLNACLFVPARVRCCSPIRPQMAAATACVLTLAPLLPP